MFFVAAVRKYLHEDGWPTEGNNVSMLAENTLKAARGIIFLLSEDGFLKAARGIIFLLSEDGFLKAARGIIFLLSEDGFLKAAQGMTSLLAGDNKRPRQTE